MRSIQRLAAIGPTHRRETEEQGDEAIPDDLNRRHDHDQRDDNPVSLLWAAWR